jgi:hypothetical protein
MYIACLVIHIIWWACEWVNEWVCAHVHFCLCVFVCEIQFCMSEVNGICGLIKNIQDVIYCKKTSAFSSYYWVFSFKVGCSRLCSVIPVILFSACVVGPYGMANICKLYSVLSVVCLSVFSPSVWSSAWGAAISHRVPSVKPQKCCALPKSPWHSGPLCTLHCPKAEAGSRSHVWGSFQWTASQRHCRFFV